MPKSKLDKAICTPPEMVKGSELEYYMYFQNWGEKNFLVFHKTKGERREPHSWEDANKEYYTENTYAYKIPMNEALKAFSQFKWEKDLKSKRYKHQYLVNPRPLE